MEETPQEAKQAVVDLAEDLMDEGLGDAAALTDVSGPRFVLRAGARADEILAEVRPEQETVEAAQLWLDTVKARSRTRRLSWVILVLASGFSALAIWGGSPAVTPAVIAGLAGLWTSIALFRARSRVEDAASRASEHGLQTGLPPEGRLLEAQERHEAALRRAVESWLAEQINFELGEIYNPVLPELNPSGLAEVDDPEREIPTKAREDLENLIEGMPGGAIGIAGPRGSGKSTLIRRITTWDHPPEEDEPPRSIVVDAPVEYEAREFVLHLFASLCEAVLGQGRVDSLRNWNEKRRRATLAALRTPLSTLGLALLGIGGLVLLAVLREEGQIHLVDFKGMAIVVASIGVALLFATVLSNPGPTMRWLRGLRADLRPVGREADKLMVLAETRLRQIWFQRSFSSGWSGALKLPLGVQVGADGTTQLAENQLSFPDVVHLYKEFVSVLSVGGPVRIGIDELDKMEDEQARRFLNEIKVIFRIDRCFYLVSVSEDAMSDFERRGLPFRDVFDSSFDEVLKVGYLDFEGSHRLLRRRVVGLPLQFVGLCHALGGGLARDVIRVARQVCAHDEGKTITQVTEEICERQLSDRCEAARVAMRRIKDPRYVVALSFWIGKLQSAAGSELAVFKLCRDFGDELVPALERPREGDPESPKEYREALSIATEMITFAYFVVTVLAVSRELGTEEATKEAVEDETLDGLAEARQTFAVSTAEAWERISVVRMRREGAEPIPVFATPKPGEEGLPVAAIAPD
jgi:hypothetical protein